MAIAALSLAVRRAFYSFWRMLYKPADQPIIKYVREKFPGLSGVDYLRAVQHGEELKRIWDMSTSPERPNKFAQYAPPRIGESGIFRARISAGWKTQEGVIVGAKSRIQFIRTDGSVKDVEDQVLEWLNEDAPDNDTIAVGQNVVVPEVIGFIVWEE
jgi:hypothetical protein